MIPFAVAMSTTGMDEFTNVAKTIADFGVTIVVCAVVIIFLFKILNTMVKQIEATQQSVLPEIQKIGDRINSVENNVMEAVTKHNTSSANRLYSTGTDIEKLKSDAAKMLDQLAELNACIQRLDTNIDSEQMLLSQLSNELTTLARNSDVLRAALNTYQKEKTGKE